MLACTPAKVAHSRFEVSSNATMKKSVICMPLQEVSHCSACMTVSSTVKLWQGATALTCCPSTSLHGYSRATALTCCPSTSLHGYSCATALTCCPSTSLHGYSCATALTCCPSTSLHGYSRPNWSLEGVAQAEFI